MVKCCKRSFSNCGGKLYILEISKENIKLSYTKKVVACAEQKDNFGPVNSIGMRIGGGKKAGWSTHW